MNKIDQLRDAVINSDQSSFIHIIHDFSEDDIIRLTEGQFEEVLKCCAKIKLNRIKEFSNFLHEEGLQAIVNSDTDKVKENALIARFYLSLVLTMYSKHDEYFANITMHLGLSYLKLAEFGVEPITNLEASIKLQQEVRDILPKESLDYAGATLNLGNAYENLARLGIEPLDNLEESIKLQQEAREIFPKSSLNYARATVNLGNTYKQLSELGIEPLDNLEEFIKYQQEAREIFPKNCFDYAGATLNQGFAHFMLAELGMEPEKNLEESVKLQQEAREKSPKKSPEYARASVNLGIAHERLAELGIEPIDNLEKSINLHEEAKMNFFKKSPDYARAAMNLGIARKILAELGIDSINNLKESIKSQQEARDIFQKNSPEYAGATVNLGNAHALLADFGVTPEKNLEQCIELHQEAREMFPTGCLDYAGNFMNLGVAYLRLADLETEPITNLEESIKLLEEAREIFPKNSGAYARTTMNLGLVHARLLELGVDMEKKFKIAEELYEISKAIFQEIKDGWGYSDATLNHYILYRKFFWKNGDRNYLKKVNDVLVESKKNIEMWDVLRKNEIIGELYSIEADLCELDDDYYNAGMKYRDAYSLTKNLYYKFMCEFSRAKLSKDEKPFCKLAYNWITEDKTEIFLDFYDYAVFECHLEEAIENEALRFDEINAAKNKLEEVFNRTQIQHIKTRVGACIDILNGYLNYFPENDLQKDENAAKENISHACKIFKSIGYRHEIDICNLFIVAIKNKDQQEVWLNLIKNHLSDNLSKLIGEAAISEIAKSQTIGIKADLREIKTEIKEMKINIDDIIFSLKPGISEELVITVGAEFYGTGAQHVITIPLQEISYHDLKKNLETIKDKKSLKLASLPPKLAEKVKDYLIRK